MKKTWWCNKKGYTEMIDEAWLQSKYSGKIKEAFYSIFDIRHYENDCMKEQVWAESKRLT